MSTNTIGTTAAPSLLAYQNTLNAVQLQMQATQAQLQSFQADPLPALLNAGLPIGITSVATSSTTPATAAGSSPVTVKVKWWGVDIIMDEMLTQQVAKGLLTAAQLSEQIAANMNSDSKGAAAVQAAIYAIALACLEKTAETKSADKGSGVHWPISWVQWLAVLGAFPLGPPAILVQVLIFIHPAPNHSTHQPIWHWGPMPAPTDGASVVASLGNAAIGSTPYVFVLDNQGNAQGCAFYGHPFNWIWHNLACPSGASIAFSLGIAQVPDGDYTLFCMGSDNHLWRCAYDSNSGWQWTQEAAPSERIVSGAGILLLGGILNVFGLDSEGALWTCHFYQKQWSWELVVPQQPLPAGVTLQCPMGVSYSNNIPNVLAMGSDNNLYTYFYQNGWQLKNLEQPKGGTFPYLPMGTFTVGGDANVLGIGIDNNLATCYFDSDWMWGNLGQPDTATIVASAGSAWVGSQANIFGMGTDGNLWTCAYDGIWLWSSLGQPSVTTAIGFPLGSLEAGGAPNAFCVGTDGNVYTCWNS